MWEVLNYDQIRQSIPFYLYQKLTLPSSAGTLDAKFIFTIPRGFVYLLRTIHTRLPLGDRDNDLTTDLQVEFLQPLRGRALQNLPYPLRLISTPGIAEGVPVTAAMAGILKNNILLNYVYYREDTISIRFTYKVLNKDDALEMPCMLAGYYMPDTFLKQWG